MKELDDVITKSLDIDMKEYIVHKNYLFTYIFGFGRLKNILIFGYYENLKVYKGYLCNYKSLGKILM